MHASRTTPTLGLILAFVLTLFLSNNIFAQTTLVPAGSTWKYLDNGSNQGTGWQAVPFDDSTWASGPAQLGYGDGDEATVVSYGSDANHKYITTYFRKSFTVANPGSFSNLLLRVKRDDGVVVYLNGAEVFRENMPTATITYTTGASSTCSDDGTTFLQTNVSGSLLLSGTNVLAVEIHQVDGASSDISFDLELVGTTGAVTANVTRGPYLQMGSPTAVTARWRTDVATDSRVRYGDSPSNLNLFVDDVTLTTEHTVRLTGLAANTTYYFSVGTIATGIAGGDANHFFITTPTSAKPTRVWVLGDAGSNNADQRAVRDAYYNFTGTRHTDLWLMLGDNAYDTGTDTEYQNAVFNTYQTVLRKSVLWPTIGNHDTAQSPNPSPTIPYYQIFNLPQNAEAGGLASGTEDYYSFDYGNIHFVCLDSMTSARTAGSPMLVWLQNDLAANTKDWVIAFWHHPPYSKGSHDSDTETELVEMRQNALPILEQYGVDLVMSGHSHSYERSFLIDGHYGVSTTFDNTMKKDGGDGRPTGTGAYTKPTLGPGVHEGAVYVVAGSGGFTSGGSLNHPAMFISLNNLGSFVIDVDGNRLDAKLIRETGAVGDNFTIIKGSANNIPPTVSITDPASGSTFNDPPSITIDATANDSDGSVTKVDFYQGATLLGSDTSAPYSLVWNNPAPGSYTLTAKATDNLGGLTTSSAVNITVTTSNLPPTVSITNPLDGATFYAPATITIDATANDGDGSVTKVDFYQGAMLLGSDTTAPYQFVWSNVAMGSYSITAKATDNRGAVTTSSAVNVTVNSATPAAPSNLTAVAASQTQINLTWNDNSGNETGFKIERSNNGMNFSQIATVGANVTSFSSTGLRRNKVYYYRVRAYSAAGNSAYSNTASARTLQ